MKFSAVALTIVAAASAVVANPAIHARQADPSSVIPDPTSIIPSGVSSAIPDVSSAVSSVIDDITSGIDSVPTSASDIFSSAASAVSSALDASDVPSGAASPNARLGFETPLLVGLTTVLMSVGLGALVVV